MRYEPNNVEKGMRFGCGCLLGLLLGPIFLIRHLNHLNKYLLLSFIIICGLLFGFAAMKQGDRFWDRFIEGKFPKLW